jgi:hypothetical protein
MIQSPAQSNPLPEQNKVPGAKPQETTAGTKHADAADGKAQPNVAPLPGSNANVKS